MAEKTKRPEYNLTAFMTPDLLDRQNETKEIIVSKAFKDADGNVVPWTIRKITPGENDKLRKEATHMVYAGGTQVTRTDTPKYLMNLVLKCVTFPDLHDARLLDYWHASTQEDLLMYGLLTADEYDDLTTAVLDFNGYDISGRQLSEGEDVEAAKN